MDQDLARRWGRLSLMGQDLSMELVVRASMRDSLVDRNFNGRWVWISLEDKDFTLLKDHKDFVGG